MREDRTRWNKRYEEKDWPDAPSDIVHRFCHLAKPGRALDIAAGTGRNSVFLAREGFDVVALDISDLGLQRISGAHERLHPLCIDLDTFDIPENRYQLIINVRFLNRRLFPWILNGLEQDGVLIFETYIDFHGGDGHRHSRDYFLEENELLRAFLPLHIIYYEESKYQTDEGLAHMASLVAVKK